MDNNLNNTISKAFGMMFFGLLISGITAWFTYNTNALETVLANNAFNFILLFELGVVILFSWCSHRLSPNTVKLLYFIYAVLNGLTLSVIFAIFELRSILNIFLISAVGFGILAFIGVKLDVDLTKFRVYVFISLLCGFILSLLNILIFKSSAFELILDLSMLAVFFGVTIYDINKFKYNNIDDDKTHIYLAMDLYLDFINIFIRLLNLFGKRND